MDKILLIHGFFNMQVSKVQKQFLPIQTAMYFVTYENSTNEVYHIFIIVGNFLV